MRRKPRDFSGYKLRSCIAAAVVVGATAMIGNWSVAATEPQVAGRVSGNNLYDSCIQPPDTEKQVQQETFCMGYVVGVIEGGAYDACLPHKLMFVQAKDIVIAWLRNNPTQRHLNAAVLVRIALESTYPCQ